MDECCSNDNSRSEMFDGEEYPCRYSKSFYSTCDNREKCACCSVSLLSVRGAEIPNVEVMRSAKRAAMCKPNSNSLAISTVSSGLHPLLSDRETD